MMESKAVTSTIGGVVNWIGRQLAPSEVGSDSQNPDKYETASRKPIEDQSTDGLTSTKERYARSTTDDYNRRSRDADREDGRVLVDIRQAKSQISALEKELQVAQEKLYLMEQRKERYKNKYNDTSAVLHSTQSELQQYKHAYQDCYRKYETVTIRYNDLESQLRQRERQDQAAIASLQLQKEQMTSLIEQRHGEVQAAKEFLDSQDKLSGADIVNKVRALNEQIFQISATMAESCKYRKPEGSATDLVDKTQHIFDRLLPAIDHGENPEIVQIALQSRLVLLSLHIGPGWGNKTSWTSPIPQFLDALARSVREEKAPVISRRWRSITHAHSISLGGATDDFVKDLTEEFLKTLVQVLRFAGAIIDDSIESTYAPRISNLIRQVLDVQRIINQDIMSCDYILFEGQAGAKFDLGTMLDYELDELNLKRGHRVPGYVVCTTDLGVRRLALDKGDGGGEGETVLLKPRVARDMYLLSVKEAIEAGESDDDSESGD